MVKSSIPPNVQQKPEVKLEYNDLDRKAYGEIGINAPGEVLWQERKFLNLVDLRKGEIQRNVNVIVRLKAIDYSAPSGKHERKEFLYYTEDWIGKDIHNIPIYCRDHIEGYYTKRFLRPKIGPNGDILYNELDPNKRQVTYTIPFTKKRLDEIIDRSAESTKDTIKFCIKFSNADARELGYGDRQENRTYISYEMFKEWEFTELFYYNLSPPNQYYDRKAKQFKIIGVQQAVQPASHIT